MKNLKEKLLRNTLSIAKRTLMSSHSIKNAIMDLNNSSEFTDLYEHEKMLADSKRVDPYQKAIARYVKPGDTLVDLGTGSGILAILASRNRPKKIYAIDHSDFIDVAREATRRNGASEIEFLKVNSRSFTPPEKLDMILHEQIGDELFDENMIDNLLDLKRRLLKPGGKILPGKFELYLEPVMLRDEFRVPMIWEMSPHDIDFSFLKESHLSEKYRSSRYDYRYLPPFSVKRFLCREEPVLTVDLNKDEAVTNLQILPQEKLVERSGRVDGVCVYFNVVFDEEISLSTHPSNGYSSWGNRLFRMPARTVEPGDMIRFRMESERIESPDTWRLVLPERVMSNGIPG